MLCSPGGGFVTEPLYMMSYCNKTDIEMIDTNFNERSSTGLEKES
jgi:hypothetical protein